ncbi:MAG: transcription antitermination factor NusB [Pseudomonadota bacterium]
MAPADQKLPFEVKRARRAGARLAAVQALYQMEQTGQSAKAAIRDLMNDRLGVGPDEDPVEEADPDLFKSIVNATVIHQASVDQAVLSRLSNGWKLSRLDATTRAILRAAAAELIAHQDLSRQILLDEYVSLAHDFFDTTEANFVNAVLDNVAKDLRPGEA